MHPQSPPSRSCTTNKAPHKNPKENSSRFPLNRVPLAERTMEINCREQEPVKKINLHDSGVKVVVRVRPLNKREQAEGAARIVYSVSHDCIAIEHQLYTFDGIAGENSTQQDVFELVGLPMVEHCVAGFNSSIFAFGQTGSGKTYTMWGTVLELNSGMYLSDNTGLAPKVFKKLFPLIQQEERGGQDEVHYECRCSFLEIYNEQIKDLLEPTAKNLQIREDAKLGVYIDNLTEEPVSSAEEANCLLLKGLANRRVGSTGANYESSRSHCVFTCIIERHSKNLHDGTSSIKSSKINLVDLAGSERQKQTGAAGERLKEAGNINRSLSQLGNVINILADIALTGKQRHVPYRDSRLTFLLQESLGGNSQLAVVCAISPASSCRNETQSTLRFAQRAKNIQNKAVVNEETTTDANFLREQIRQLKHELRKIKELKYTFEPGVTSTLPNWHRERDTLEVPFDESKVPQDSSQSSDIESEYSQSSIVNDQNSTVNCTRSTANSQPDVDWISIAKKLQKEVEEYEAQVTYEGECLQGLRQAHAKILEEYTDLQESHVTLLAQHRTLRERAKQTLDMEKHITLALCPMCHMANRVSFQFNEEIN